MQEKLYLVLSKISCGKVIGDDPHMKAKTLKAPNPKTN